MTEVKNCRIQAKKNIYKPLFHQILKTSKQRKHAAIQRVLRKYYKLKTYSKPLHLLLTSNVPYILNNDQSKYSKRCWNWTNERKSQKFACDSTKESTKEGLICVVREEPNSVEPCQFRFLTNHCQARATNPRKQPEKLGWESGVFSGALRNAFRDPKTAPKSLRAREVFGSFEKRTPGHGKTAEIEPITVYVILLAPAKKIMVWYVVPSGTSCYCTELTLSCIFSVVGAWLGQAMSVVTSQGTATSLNILRHW